jgi:hypothetical protein
MEFIRLFLSKRQIGKDVVDDGLRDKYFEQKDGKNKDIFSKSNKVLEPTDECFSTRHRQTDVCPICYEILIDEDACLTTKKHLLSCPDCKNYVHQQCIEKWIEYNTTCVYCRSSVWFQFKNKSSDYMKLE